MDRKRIRRKPDGRRQGPIAAFFAPLATILGAFGFKRMGKNLVSGIPNAVAQVAAVRVPAKAR